MSLLRTPVSRDDAAALHSEVQKAYDENEASDDRSGELATQLRGQLSRLERYLHGTTYRENDENAAN